MKAPLRKTRTPTGVPEGYRTAVRKPVHRPRRCRTLCNRMRTRVARARRWSRLPPFRTLRHPASWIALAALAVVSTGPGMLARETPGHDWRVMASGERPPDRRLGELRTLDSHCPFTPAATRDAWQARAVLLRRQVRVALGLWPWPTKTPLNARVTGTVAREGYVVDRVAIESVPGHFVTGSLYRPTGRSGRLPAVLSPHGHWPGGRFQDVAADEVARQRASGAEDLDVAARHILQARAVHLARLGAIVFLIDLEGYADSQQLGTPLVHEFARPRPEMATAEALGVLHAAGRAPPAERARTGRLECRPRPRLPHQPARRGHGTRRRHRCERRRHPDLPAGRDRRSAGGALPGGHGLDAHAGRVHLRERQLPAHRHRQRGARRASPRRGRSA